MNNSVVNKKPHVTAGVWIVALFLVWHLNPVRLGWKSNMGLTEVTHAVVHSLQNKAAERIYLAVVQCIAFGCHLQFSLRSVSALQRPGVQATIASLHSLGYLVSFPQLDAASTAVLLLKCQY